MTRKITWHAANISSASSSELALGNLDSERDWGYAKDYVEGMWRMLQQDEPDDYVLATGQTQTVQKCVEVAFDEVGLNWQDYVRIDPQFVRPAEVDLLIGDYSRPRDKLGLGTHHQLRRTHPPHGPRRPRPPQGRTADSARR